MSIVDPAGVLAAPVSREVIGAVDDWTFDPELARKTRVFDIGHNVLTWEAVLAITVVRISRDPVFTGWCPVRSGTFLVISYAEKDRLLRIMRFVRQEHDDTGAECATPGGRDHHATAIDSAVADVVDDGDGGSGDGEDEGGDGGSGDGDGEDEDGDGVHANEQT